MSATSEHPVSSTESRERRRQTDRLILILLAAFLALTAAIIVAWQLAADDAELGDVFPAAVAGIIMSVTMAGIPAAIRYRNSGIVGLRKLLKWAAVLSLVGSIVSTAAIAVASQLYPESVELPPMTSAEFAIAVLAVAFGTVMVYFVMIIALAVLSFGLVGVMCAAERKLTPWVMRRVVLGGVKESPTMLDRSLRWLFDIPEVLDPRNLTINPAPRRTSVCWSDLKAPVAWQMLFGTVLAIYVSFNPFFTDRSPAALIQIFSLLSSIAFVLPLVILPWFIFLRLGASIRGQAKEFTLYRGIRARVLQSYFAIGTIVLFVRLSITTVDLTTFLQGLGSFLFTLLVAATLSTFVYFNYFENDLAEDIIRDFSGSGQERDKDT